MIVLDYKDPRPVYEQIVDRIQFLIEQGVLRNDEKLPSVRSLAIDLSINPNTVQKAYAELERRGFLYTMKGRGNYVSFDEEMKRKSREMQMKNFEQATKQALEAGLSKDELTEIVRSITL